MPEINYLTAEGLIKLQAEFAELKGPAREELAKRLRHAIQQGLGGSAEEGIALAVLPGVLSCVCGDEGYPHWHDAIPSLLPGQDLLSGLRHYKAPRGRSVFLIQDFHVVAQSAEELLNFKHQANMVDLHQDQRPPPFQQFGRTSQHQ